MARLSDSPYHSNSDALPSSPENNTFGHPLRTEWVSPSDSHFANETSVQGDIASSSDSANESIVPPIPLLRVSPSNISGITRSEIESDAGTVTEPAGRTLGVPIPGRDLFVRDSQADISTAAQSFITAPATVHGSTTTDSDEVPGHRSPPGWGAIQNIGGHFDHSMRPV